MRWTTDAGNSRIEGRPPRRAARRPMRRWVQLAKVVIGVINAAFWIPLGLLGFAIGLFDPNAPKVALVFGPAYAAFGVSAAVYAVRAWRSSSVKS